MSAGVAWRKAARSHRLMTAGLRHLARASPNRPAPARRPRWPPGSGLAEFLQDRHRFLEHCLLGRGQIPEPASQPRLAQLTNLAYHVATLDGHGEYDLPAVAWMWHPLNQAAFFERCDDPGDRRRLHLLVLGEFAGCHRELLERRQGGEL